MREHKQAFARAISPRKKLTVSQWADACRILSGKSSSEPGEWRTSRAPYTREIMDALSVSSPVQRIVLMFSAQTSKTEIGLNWLGYIIHHSPAPALVVVPTLEVRKRWVKQRFNPMLVDTPVLAEIFDARRSRDASNAEDIKDFPGGVIVIGGANSPASLSSMPIKYVMCDEVDRFPWEAGQEGDPLGLIDERTKTFPRRKVLLVSTPTIKGASRIETKYLKSDQRRYYVPCPHCQEMQTLKWSNIRWSIDDFEVKHAWYVCEHCGAEFDESHKTWMLEHGKWIPAYPGREIRGYTINGLYSPNGLGFKWVEIVRQWLDAQSDPTKLKRFINTTLGETWEDKASKLDAHSMLKCLENIPQRSITRGCLALTVGIDTQDKWLAVKLLGWGADNLWIIEWHTIEGDTTRPEVWDKLEEYLNTPLINSCGNAIRIEAAAIDTRGHRGEQVKKFIARKTLKVPVYAVQGSTTRLGRAIATTASHPEKTHRGKVVKTGYSLWNVGTEYCKDFIYGTLASDEKLPTHKRVIHFPEGLTEDYFDGLLSEILDPETNRYIKRKGAKHQRNEPLDTLVYAWAIGHHNRVRIGMTSRGEFDPGYWTRRSHPGKPIAFYV
ncbi:phage terminase large subunit family protein [Nitrosomonas communis]|uniref:phage terminase large subunit family protein n=1 Tax=Nitrosomonas communis TaxID=44574 RepID=UPI003D29FEF1